MTNAQHPDNAQDPVSAHPRPTTTTTPDPADERRFDVIVLGGGAAGLSTATALGRARRRVAVIDAGEPRNAPAEGVHNFLSREGVNPLELVRIGRADAEQYGVSFFDGSAETAERTADGFAVALGDGTVLFGRRIVLATGVVDELPPVDGLRERWGNDVLHCPYCHGWEVRDQRIGILGSGPMAMHQTILFSQWSDDVTLYLGTAPEPTAEELEQLAARGIPVVRGIVASVEVVDDAITALVLEDGSAHAVEAVVVGPRFAVRAGALAALGLEPVPHPSGVGTMIDADAQGRTSVPGVWAVGNASNPMGQVVVAAASGMMAGAVINAELVTEEVAADVERYRAARSVSPRP
ncbi:NAD(P)/FAD-dependent oxidoreductase [Plantibacter sp. Mn2098]|uniref:NAD(P)/FAD-dependent oxidoreductase n=1 Tax=Plantibacter sp. Mn2098 TaxID=3395266 RepID=UPI003BEB2B18